MARYNCRSCGFVGAADWAGQLACPSCKSDTQVGVAIAGWELAEVKLSKPEADVLNVERQLSQNVLVGRPNKLYLWIPHRIDRALRSFRDGFRGYMVVRVLRRRSASRRSAAFIKFASLARRTTLLKRLRPLFAH